MAHSGKSGASLKPMDIKQKGREKQDDEFAEDFGSLKISDVESLGSTAVTQGGSQAVSRKALDIAEFFKLVTNEKGEKKRVCKVCSETANPSPKVNYTYAEKTATGNLRNHLINHHKTLYEATSVEQGWKIKTTVAGPTVGQLRKSSLPLFSPDAFVEYLVRFVAADDQAIRLVECPEFRDICMLLRESLNDKQIPRRHMLREGILRQFKKEFGQLKLELSGSAGKISLTTDMWSNKKLSSFLAVTAHWIARHDGKLTLRAALIGFLHVKGKHTGEGIGNGILQIAERAGITEKIGHITMDNASNNDSAMIQLERILKKKKIRFDAKQNRIRCFPHIINICVSHITKSFDKISQRGKGNVEESDDKSGDEISDDQESDNEESDVGCSDEEDDDDPVLQEFMDEEDMEEWFHAIKQNPVRKGRKIIRTIRSSGQRREGFQLSITTGNQSQAFVNEKNQPIVVKQLQLLPDVKHRWDSLHVMLERMRDLRPAIDRYLRADLPALNLRSIEWDVLDGLYTVLDAPHDVHQVMSAHLTPVLSGAIPSFEIFMSNWEDLGEAHSDLKPWTTIGLKWANKYYKKMDDTDAYVIAMFINPCTRFSWIEEEWDKKYQVMAKKMILDAMKRYRISEVSGSTPQVPASPVKQKPAHATYVSRYQLAHKKGKKDKTTPMDSEEEEFEKYKRGTLSQDDTDLVEFWQMNRKEYPRLYSMAMDYLPIQASAVPCERVFSSAGETDTKKRNRMSPVLMEALQILKFIYKNDRLDFSAGRKPMKERHVEVDESVGLESLLSKDPDVENNATDLLLRDFLYDDTDEE